MSQYGDPGAHREHEGASLSREEGQAVDVDRDAQTGVPPQPETQAPLASPPDKPAPEQGGYEEPPVQETQIPPPAFPDQPDPSDPLTIDEAEELRTRRAGER